MSKQISKIYHAAIYVRLSKEDGDVSTSAKAESNSISNQKDFIRNFLADKKDIRIVKEYVDDGYSGSNFDRPSFQTMMEDIKRGVIDCVVVKDLSRFGREYIDSGRYIERLFPALDVRFLSRAKTFHDVLEVLAKVSVPSGALVTLCAIVIVIALTGCEDAQVVGVNIAVALLALIYSIVEYLVVTVIKGCHTDKE